MTSKYSAGEIAYSIHLGVISAGVPGESAREAYERLTRVEIGEWEARGKRMLAFASLECEKVVNSAASRELSLGAANCCERFARISMASESHNARLMAKASFRSVRNTPWIDASDYSADQFLEDLDGNDPRRDDLDKRMDALFVEFLQEKHPNANGSMSMVAEDLGGDLDSYKGLDCSMIGDHMAAAIQNLQDVIDPDEFKKAFHAFISASSVGREVRNRIIRQHFLDEANGMKRTHRHLFSDWLSLKRSEEDGRETPESNRPT